MLNNRYRIISRRIISILILVPVVGQAFSGLSLYSTRLPWNACYNSKGSKLHNVSQILRQERVLFHQSARKHLVSPYQDESYFSSRKNRNVFSIANISMPASLAVKIKRCDPVDYTVYVYSKNNIRVRPGLISSRAG